jgi:hypothetical protein
MNKTELKGSPRQSTSRRWTASSLSRGSTRPEGQSLASGSVWSLYKQQVASNGEEITLPPPVPPPPGAHPPPTVWNPSSSSSSWQGEGVQPDGLQTLLFLPHPTPGTSRKEKQINTSKEHKKSSETTNITEENKNEGRIRKMKAMSGRSGGT